MTKTIDAKLITPEQAASLIEDGATVAMAGFGGSAAPESLQAAIAKRFLQCGKPCNLTTIHAAGQGDRQGHNLEHLAHKGLLKRHIGGHFGYSPKLEQFILAGECEGYNFPQGVLSSLFRDIAAGRPGCITHIGLDTFIDPIHEGGKMNSRTTEDLVERVELGGQTWLWYKSLPIDVALLRATAADPLGNLIFNEEAAISEPLPIAQAAHNSGGIVIAQVKRLLDRPARPHEVRVPGMLVDHLVIADGDQHMQTWKSDYEPRYVEPQYVDEPISSLFEPMPLDERRIIAARAIEELPEGAIANLGVGIPEGIAQIAAERGLTSHFTLTVESGVIGGAPESGIAFGASVHPEAILDQPAIFDLYDGGGLDFAALGLAQVDPLGNINVSRFGTRAPGVGGFMNITQTAKRLVFCGTFTAAGLRISVHDGKLNIDQEGKVRKFVGALEQLTYSAGRAMRQNQQVLIVTERAVFKLTADGLELIELAPGINLDSQVLALMDFEPVIGNIQPMPARVFEVPLGADI
jgi:propionate CoA-transferase